LLRDGLLEPLPEVRDSIQHLLSVSLIDPGLLFREHLHLILELLETTVGLSDDLGASLVLILA
jgi:hypothetical protein